MNVIESINRLESENLLIPLLQAGVISQKSFLHREIYNVFCNYRASMDFTVTECVRMTAKSCRVGIATVWNAKKAMERTIK